MKPVLRKAGSRTVLENKSLELICPLHPRVWCEEFTENGEYPDTIEFCECCSGDCTPFCKNCDSAEVGA